MQRHNIEAEQEKETRSKRIYLAPWFLVDCRLWHVLLAEPLPTLPTTIPLRLGGRRVPAKITSRTLLRPLWQLWVLSTPSLPPRTSSVGSTGPYGQALDGHEESPGPGLPVWSDVDNLQQGEEAEERRHLHRLSSIRVRSTTVSTSASPKSGLSKSIAAVASAGRHVDSCPGAGSSGHSSE